VSLLAYQLRAFVLGSLVGAAIMFAAMTIAR
jgi:hypothetical protein